MLFNLLYRNSSNDILKGIITLKRKVIALPSNITKTEKLKKPKGITGFNLANDAISREAKKNCDAVSCKSKLECIVTSRNRNAFPLLRARHPCGVYGCGRSLSFRARKRVFQFEEKTSKPLVQTVNKGQAGASRDESFNVDNDSDFQVMTTTHIDLINLVSGNPHSQPTPTRKSELFVQQHFRVGLLRLPVGKEAFNRKPKTNSTEPGNSLLSSIFALSTNQPQPHEEQPIQEKQIN
ncbi:hypothetical protein Ocin01_04235 [Orchesella cincta]|uniref:Uncharacterized protein n=1 Tax=Orchesella cincta TaxID=48709 RepID=A0A1D2NB33_ORCCI|nr:hypothetical protein Ocin01_04235 [Orchesella cincta]